MKACLYSAHHVTYGEYESKLKTLLVVERKREKEYEKSVDFVSAFDKKLVNQ